LAEELGLDGDRERPVTVAPTRGTVGVRGLMGTLGAGTEPSVGTEGTGTLATPPVPDTVVVGTLGAGGGVGTTGTLTGGGGTGILTGGGGTGILTGGGGGGGGSGTLTGGGGSGGGGSGTLTGGGGRTGTSRRGALIGAEGTPSSV
jgi:hypothetical protein